MRIAYSSKSIQRTTHSEVSAAIPSIAGYIEEEAAAVKGSATKNPSFELQVAAHALIAGPLELLANVAPGGHLPTLSLTTARDYFIGKILVVMQRAGLCAHTAIAIEKEIADASKEDRRSRGFIAKLASQNDQQTLWQRKLAEALSSLVGFASTNDPAFYYHRLQVERLRALSSQQIEQKEFFGSESAVRKHQIDSLFKQIEDLEKASQIDLNRCWYLAKPSPTKRNIATHHSMVKFALATGTTSEKQALGYGYEFAFSVPSETLHFSPASESEDRELGRFLFGWSRVFLLATAILNRAQQLLGVSPAGGWCEAARKQASTAPEVFLVGRAVVGDFVAVEVDDRLYLGEVLEVSISAGYGYESYRVRYLDDKPLNVAEDWVVKGMATPLPRADLLDTMRAAHPEVFTQFSTAEIEDASRKAVVQGWRLGLRAYSERQVKEARQQASEDDINRWPRDSSDDEI